MADNDLIDDPFNPGLKATVAEVRAVTYLHATLAADEEEDETGPLHAAAVKAEAELSHGELLMLSGDLKNMRARVAAEKLHADPEHPGNTGRAAEEAIAEDLVKPLDGQPEPFEDPEFRHTPEPEPEPELDVPATVAQLRAEGNDAMADALEEANPEA